jgi:uncharacterized RDD family membrane protein YckC
MFCTKCGAKLSDGAQFCTVCGAAVSTGAPQPPAAAPTFAPSAPPAYAAPQYASLPPAAYPFPGQPGTYRPAVDYAGFWLRFVAFLIDSVVWGIPIVFVVCMIAAAMGIAGAFKNIGSDDSPSDLVNILGLEFLLVASLLIIVGRWVYYAAFESSAWQGTLGKKALGLYVTDLNGNRVTFRRATGRFFSRIVTGMIPLWIGYIMAGFTEKRQALHDMIASCLVLRKL